MRLKRKARVRLQKALHTIHEEFGLHPVGKRIGGGCYLRVTKRKQEIYYSRKIIQEELREKA